MEGSPGIGWRSGSDGSRAPPKIPPAMEELQSRLQETLDLLSSQELRSFRDHLRKVEPRVSQVKLELEGRSPSELARLLAKQYYPPAAAKRVLVQVLEQLPRADLLPRWQSAAADGPVIPRKIPKRSYDCVEGELDHYDLSGRRKAFLMCVKRNRLGAHQDVLLMEDWLGQCQFENTLCIDPDKMELLGKITSFRDGLNEIKDDIGCCLVALMSHGEEGFIRMKDGEKVSLEGIFEMFNNKNCPALQEKPKIFIIQACRGERRDSGVETDDEPMDSDDGSEKRRLPTFSDYFIIYPTQADHVALRDPRTGSVMIKAMTEVFKQYGNKWHIADFFTKVNNRVVHREFNLRNEPIKVSLVMESTLTKFVYF
ncbi:caspase-14-like [Balaenoptera acutorostrata]|uniref:Caspase-14-like n=1 Tax=Balaenoptera acutorostrata TaxID=9767 RepID=A0ABM3U8V3_BALAC|nr:caspase-14-like [Balaenoptera acutorostrata]